MVHAELSGFTPAVFVVLLLLGCNEMCNLLVVVQTSTGTTLSVRRT